MNDQYQTILKASVEIEAPINQVWEVVKDYGNIYQFHPMVKYSRSTNDKEGLGAKRLCKLSPMGEMEEEITMWEEGRSFTSEVYGGKMLPPTRMMKGTLELEAKGNRTIATFQFCYQMRFGMIGRLMDVIMIRPQFKKAPSKYMAGLKHYIESRAAILT